jgi:hypothetical protein
MINMEAFLKSDGKVNRPMDGVRNIMPYALAPDSFDGTVPYTIPAAGGGALLLKYSGINNFQTIWGTPFELKRFIFATPNGGTPTADVSVRLRMMAGRDFMNAPVHIRTLYGLTNAVGHLPSFIREPLFLFTSEYIMAEFENLSGGSSKIFPYMLGVQYYPITGKNATPGDLRIVDKIKKWRNRSRSTYPFWLTTPAPIVHAAVVGDTQQSQIKIADTPYEASSIACVATNTDFELEIKEVVSGQTLMNGRITQTNGLGDSALPTVLPFSYMLPKGAILRITTTQLAASTNTIYLTFQGRKINAPMADFKVDLSKSDSDIYTDADYEQYLEKETIGATA